MILTSMAALDVRQPSPCLHLLEHPVTSLSVRNGVNRTLGTQRLLTSDRLREYAEDGNPLLRLQRPRGSAERRLSR